MRIWIYLLAAVLVCFFAYLASLYASEWPEEHNQSVVSMDWPPNGVRDNGALQVDGCRLLNSRGAPVMLRGMSSHGLAWYPEYTNYRALESLRKRGANVFRAAMYADGMHGGYSESPEYARLNKSLLLQAVENALAADMYVIVDWHLLMDQTPLPTIDKAVAFFDEISTRYAHEQAVIYEICNEPNGMTTWEDITAYAAQVIPVIRKNAPHALVIVGSPEFSTNLTGPLHAPLPFENILYSYHFYSGEDNPYYKILLEKMQEAGLAVFVSEWGVSKNKKTGALHLEEARQFLAFLEERGISWVNWSLCNNPEEFSAIRSDVISLSGWNDDDLTPSGKLIFRAFGGKPSE